MSKQGLEHAQELAGKVAEELGKRRKTLLGLDVYLFDGMPADQAYIVTGPYPWGVTKVTNLKTKEEKE